MSLAIGAPPRPLQITAALAAAMVLHLGAAFVLVRYRAEVAPPALPRAFEVVKFAAAPAPVVPPPAKAPPLRPRPPARPQAEHAAAAPQPVEERAPLRQPAAPVAPPAVEAAASAALEEPPAESAAPRYVPPDAAAAYLDNPKPLYPAVARRRGIEGVVWLRVSVSETGAALAVEVKESAGFKPLDTAALHAVRGWRFVPAQRDGRPVAATVELPVRFRLE